MEKEKLFHLKLDEQFIRPLDVPGEQVFWDGTWPMGDRYLVPGALDVMPPAVNIL